MSERTAEQMGKEMAFPAAAVYIPEAGLSGRVEDATLYGVSAGLTVKQLVWIHAYAAYLGRGYESYDAGAWADGAVEFALDRLKDMS